MVNVVRASVVAALALLACSSVAEKKSSTSGAALEQVSAIALPDVKGRIDHMALGLLTISDPPGKVLLIAALGNDTVEAVDLSSGEVARRRGFDEPQGVAYASSKGQGDCFAVTNGKSGDLVTWDYG